MAAYTKAKKDPYVTYVVKEDVPENPTVAYIKEHSLEFQGVQVEASYLRQYPFGAFATHVWATWGRPPRTTSTKSSSPPCGRARPWARTAWSASTTPSCGAPTAGRPWR